MNKRIKERWLTALDSGEYNIGKNRLYVYETDTYCPLGILVEIAIDEGHKVEAVRRKNQLGFFIEGVVINGSPYSIAANDDIASWAELNSEEIKRIVTKNDTQSLSAVIEYIRDIL